MRSTDFLAGLKALGDIQPLESSLFVDKAALLAAEVSLPLAPGFPPAS